MRSPAAEGLRWPRLWRRRDLLALVIVVGYGALAVFTALGANVGGQGLDPVLAAARQRGALRVAVDFGYYPFSGMQHDQPIGYDVDLARAVAQKLGLKVEFVPSNLDSIYDDLARGKADMAASALPYAPEQGWRVTFSEFYFNAGLVLVVPQDSPIQNQDQLGGHALGVPLGSDADSYARKLVLGNPSIRLNSDYDTPTKVLADVRAGKLDAAIVDNASALIDLGHQPGLRLVMALSFEPYALAVPSRAWKLHDEVNHSLKQFRAEGYIDQLGKKWFR
jgi:polar amino acid transport system substrate-binding protein